MRSKRHSFFVFVEINGKRYKTCVYYLKTINELMFFYRVLLPVPWTINGRNTVCFPFFVSRSLNDKRNTVRFPFFVYRSSYGKRNTVRFSFFRFPFVERWTEYSSFSVFLWPCIVRKTEYGSFSVFRLPHSVWKTNERYIHGPKWQLLSLCHFGCHGESSNPEHSGTLNTTE